MTSRHDNDADEIELHHLSGSIDDEDFDALLDASSLGSPVTDGIRALTPHKVCEELHHRLHSAGADNSNADVDDAVLTLIQWSMADAQRTAQADLCMPWHPAHQASPPEEAAPAPPFSSCEDHNEEQAPFVVALRHYVHAASRDAYRRATASLLKELLDNEALGSVKEDVAQAVRRLPFTATSQASELVRRTCLTLLSEADLPDDEFLPPEKAQIEPPLEAVAASSHGATQQPPASGRSGMPRTSSVTSDLPSPRSTQNPFDGITRSGLTHLPAIHHGPGVPVASADKIGSQRIPHLYTAMVHSDPAPVASEPPAPYSASSFAEPAPDLLAEYVPATYLSALARIQAAVDLGHGHAAVHLATVLEERAADEHGGGHPYLLRAREVRAHVVLATGDPAGAAELYVAVAQEWARRQLPAYWDAAQKAHYCWTLVSDRSQALMLGEQIVRLWQMAGHQAQPQTHAALRYLDQLLSEGTWEGVNTENLVHVG